jgi:diguanylate cyclase (GGDEF)-like protein/PAS domain S-box-containing protein
MLLPEFKEGNPLPAFKSKVVGRRQDGSFVDLSFSLSLLDEGDDPRTMATIVDISALNAAQSAARQSEARYVLAALGASDGLWDWNFQEGTIFLSSRWRSMLGLENEVSNNSPDEWLDRIHADDLVAFRDAFDNHIEGKTSQFEHEYRILHVDGAYRWMQVRGLVVREANGKAHRMAGSQSEITNRKLAEERLLHDTLHDSLTGLPNRTLLLDRVGQALAHRADNEDPDFALAILGLDRFMVVNESLGHSAGDELLVTLSRRLEAELRTGDFLGRLGGDEFAILIEDYRSVEAVEEFVRKLLDAIGQPFEVSGEELFISASFGIVFGAQHYVEANDMLRDADLAMYRAKKEGASGFEVFEERRHRPRFDQLQAETVYAMRSIKAGSQFSISRSCI